MTIAVREYIFIYKTVMKFANQRLSPLKPQHSIQYIETRNLNARIKHERCYMHYNNAVYMGDMISYKRSGQGMLLLDDGTSMITDYRYDSMVGHNVIYGRNAMTSVLFVKGSLYEMVSRTQHYIFQVIYDESNQTIVGNGLLIDFKKKRIYHLIYHGGKIVKKIVESNRKIVEEVFSNRLSRLINVKHQNALKFRLKFENGVRMRVEDNKIVVGYMDGDERVDGLGFVLRMNEETITNFACTLEMQCLERGNYSQSRLVNFGQRYFQNGNLYIGQFQDDCFNGKGLLVYPNESKWVYGFFQAERLKKLFRSSLPGGDNNTRGNLQRCMRQIHELNTKNYMSVNVSIVSWDYLSGRLEEAHFAEVTGTVVEKEIVVSEEEERLFMIEEHFVNESHNSQIDRVMVKQMDKGKAMSEKVLLNQFGSLKPKVLQIQPKYANIEDSGAKDMGIYLSRQTVTPKNQKLKRDILDNAGYQTYDTYGCMTPKSRSRRDETPNKTGKSPIKRYGHQCNAFFKL